MDDNTIRSFALDAPMRELRLSTKPLIHPNSPRVPLADLRVYGDFVDHYAFHIDSLTLNGITVSAKNLQENSGAVERPFVCVLDSGLTGILLIRYFWDALEDRMGLNKSKSISSASISFTEHRHSNGKNASSTRELQSNEDDRLFFARPIDLDWFDDDNRSPFVIIVGQTFLRRLCLTIDMDNRFVDIVHLPLGILATHAFSILPLINNSFREEMRSSHKNEDTEETRNYGTLTTSLPLTVTSAAFGSFFRPAFSFGPRSSLANALPNMSSCVVAGDRLACELAGTNADESTTNVVAMSKSESARVVDMFVDVILQHEIVTINAYACSAGGAAPAQPGWPAQGRGELPIDLILTSTCINADK
ncbi:hypothetical protein THAOC_20007 [Thalassiosira oceanica]|uniref:Uncharacterized protein n=1 Tax=Thalassiosira oceanica TaxID=159749 RepID=K0S4J6_THAOC|nr:hypothetical protein THAOC_20007 [Thalassiosira oceanica]|eukprot:EJK59734.1 hypothetical protein THAOC_20007 [Thalassiosira oceanica]